MGSGCFGLQCRAVDALRFACQPGCTRCCEVTGYVYLSEQDLRRAAAFLGMTVAAFEARYVLRYRHVLRLRKPRKGQCHFLRDGGCSIHPVKPTQCRLYPFWPELVENRAAWAREKRQCPGIGKGELVQIGTACEVASEMKRAYPSLYSDEPQN
jgi:Fe-S-cluster containining protein